MEDTFKFRLNDELAQLGGDIEYSAERIDEYGNYNIFWSLGGVEDSEFYTKEDVDHFVNQGDWVVISK